VKLLKSIKKLSLLLIVMVFIPACATIEVVQKENTDIQNRNEIVEYAESLRGIRDLKFIDDDFRNDCSGFVLGVYRSLGYSAKLDPYPNVRSISRLLYLNLRSKNLVYRRILPEIGDVVFFRGTTIDSRGRVSHVGIVKAILNDGTVIIIHYSSKGVGELRMNLKNPHSYRDNRGSVINDFLRKRSGHSDNRNLLSGELFYCYGDLYRWVKL